MSAFLRSQEDFGKENQGGGDGEREREKERGRLTPAYLTTQAIDKQTNKQITNLSYQGNFWRLLRNPKLLKWLRVTLWETHIIFHFFKQKKKLSTAKRSEHMSNLVTWHNQTAMFKRPEDWAGNMNNYSVRETEWFLVDVVGGIQGSMHHYQINRQQSWWINDPAIRNKKTRPKRLLLKFNSRRNIFSVIYLYVAFRFGVKF